MKSRMLVTAVLAVAMMAAVAGLASPTVAATWDVRADFDMMLNSNPTGAWSYGYTLGDGTGFTLNTQRMSPYWGDLWIGPYDGMFPYVGRMTGEAGYELGRIAVHPYDGWAGGPYAAAAIRWTAAAEGYYDASATWQNVNGSISGDATAYLTSGSTSTELYSGTMPIGVGSTVTYTSPSSIHLLAGDKLDFTLRNSYMAYMDVTISDAPPVPEPSALLSLGAGLMGLVGFAIRRRK